MRVSILSAIILLLLASLGLAVYGLFYGFWIVAGSPDPGSQPQPQSPTGTPVVWEGFPTPTPPPPSTALPTPTLAPVKTATPSIPCDAAEFVRDVTIPDGTTLRLGEQFTKTWRLKNAGTCAWDSGYNLVFVRGTAMNGQLSSQLPGRVLPGETVDVSVSLTAPDKPGTYTGYWMMRNPEGDHFGIGKGAIGLFWVTIHVNASGEPEPGGSEADLAVGAARQFLANQLKTEPVQIVILDWETSRWYDTCLGIELGNTFDCRPAPQGISGYSIQMKFDGRLYEVHTNSSGSYVFWRVV